MDKLLKEILTEICPDLMKTINPSIQEAQKNAKQKKYEGTL